MNIENIIKARETSIHESDQLVTEIQKVVSENTKNFLGIIEKDLYDNVSLALNSSLLEATYNICNIKTFLFTYRDLIEEENTQLEFKGIKDFISKFMLNIQKELSIKQITKLCENYTYFSDLYIISRDDNATIISLTELKNYIKEEKLEFEWVRGTLTISLKVPTKEEVHKRALKPVPTYLY